MDNPMNGLLTLRNSANPFAVFAESQLQVRKLLMHRELIISSYPQKNSFPSDAAGKRGEIP